MRLKSVSRRRPIIGLEIPSRILVGQILLINNPIEYRLCLYAVMKRIASIDVYINYMQIILLVIIGIQANNCSI